MSSPPDRYHALDSLRGFAMFLGIVLHAAISFMANPPAFWAVRDRDPSPVTDLFLFAVHDFRMQLFFLLAGFFGGLLYARYGAAGTAWHRVKRVAVPLALGLVFVIPTVMVVFLYSELESARAEGLGENPTALRRSAVELIEANPGAGSAAIIAERFTSGAAVEKLPLAHLWFLYYLLYLYAAVLLAAPLLAMLSGTNLLSRLDGAFRRVVEGRARVPLPAALTLPVLLCMKTPVADTPLGWAPEPQILGYYFVFFVFGWLLYRQRDLVPAFGRGWKLNLALANILVLPAALGLTLAGVEAEKAGAPGPPAWRAGAFAAQSLYTWLMIVGLWGAFLHYFARPSARARYLADASYWCYLASITPTVAFQFLVKDWPLPGLVKWALVTAATMAVLLTSYEWCVRYTFIGTILNGRKYREPREVKVREANAEVVAAE
jgi:peptidoglycan/LPS O-acetylase OafA/YrhL